MPSCQAKMHITKAQTRTTLQVLLGRENGMLTRSRTQSHRGTYATATTSFIACSTTFPANYQRRHKHNHIRTTQPGTHIDKDCSSDLLQSARTERVPLVRISALWAHGWRHQESSGQHVGGWSRVHRSEWRPRSCWRTQANQYVQRLHNVPSNGLRVPQSRPDAHQRIRSGCGKER